MSESTGLGERRDRQRRRKWWFAVFLLFASGIIIQVWFVDALKGHALSGDKLLTGIAPAAVVGGLVAALVAFGIGCWLYLKAIDEVELLDNLWGSAVGLYVYMLLFPSWWLLWRTGVIGEPNSWVIYFACLLPAAAVYIYRRLRTS